MQYPDVDAVARIHRDSFPNFFASRLGLTFLRELYREVIHHNEPAYVALDQQGSVAGYVMGTVAERPFFRALLIRHFPSLLLVGLISAVRNPSFMKRIFEMALKPVRSSMHGTAATLMFIAVGAGLRGRGAGKALVEEFVVDVRRRGASKVSLVALRERNEAANSFYLGLGFRLVGIVPSNDGWKNQYELTIERAA